MSLTKATYSMIDGAPFNVFDFGADPTGVDDSTTAIQAAIDAAWTAGGGSVEVPHGTYRLTSGVVVKSGVTLCAITSQASRISAANKVAVLFRCYGTGYDAVTLGETGSDVPAGIIGISIFYAPQTGISAKSHGCLIDSCAVTYASGNGIDLISGSGPTLIQNTHVISPGMHGIYVATADCRIENSEVQQPNNVATGLPANTYDCIYMSSTAGPLQIVDCRMGDDGYRSRHGINIAGGSLQITCTDLQNFVMSGIHVAGGNSHNIVGCKIASASTNASKTGVSLNSALIVNIVGNIFNGTVIGGVGGIAFNGTNSSITAKSNTFFGNWSGDSAIVYPVAGDRLLTTLSSVEGAQGYSLGAYNRSETVAGVTPVIHPGGYNEALVNVVNAGATTMTSMTGASYGQRVTLYFGDANTTVQHGTGTNNFRMNSGLSVTPTARSTITFIYTYENKFHLTPLWIEVGRTIY